jgi:TetR/AcrR family transcriptional repressor of bet genes
MQAYNFGWVRMTGERRSFRREGEGRRREALIASALDLIGEGGAEAATVRAIAERAGVTPGLIRHYFQTKEDLTRAAYLHLMDQMTFASVQVVEAADNTPESRLVAFVASSLRAPVMDAAAVGLWAGFMHKVRRDPALAEIHESSYLKYRDLLQDLIADLPDTRSPQDLRVLAIACNGVIDGLWLEGGALAAAFGPDELAQIGVRAIGAILGINLTLPISEDGTTL